MQEGQYTKTIYTLIKDKYYSKAVELLEPIAEVLTTCLLRNTGVDQPDPAERSAWSVQGHSRWQAAPNIALR